uniref:ORF1a polyprotein n=1 Tax=Olive leaf mottling virus TaxID=3162628 RepID=A0AAU7NIH0_9CLOS
MNFGRTPRRKRAYSPQAGRRIGHTSKHVLSQTDRTPSPIPERSAASLARANRRRRASERKKAAYAVARQERAEVPRNIDGSPVVSLVSRDEIKADEASDCEGKGTKSNVPSSVPPSVIKFGSLELGPLTETSKEVAEDFSPIKKKNRRQRGRKASLKDADIPTSEWKEVPKKSTTKEGRVLKAAWVVKGSCKVGACDPIFPTDVQYGRHVPTTSRSVGFRTEEEGGRTFGYFFQKEGATYQRRTFSDAYDTFTVDVDYKGNVFAHSIWRILRNLRINDRIPHGILKRMGWRIYTDDAVHVTLHHHGRLGVYRLEHESLALKLYCQEKRALVDPVKVLCPKFQEGFCYLCWFWEAAMIYNYRLDLEAVKRKLGKYPIMHDIVVLFRKIFPFCENFGFRFDLSKKSKKCYHASLFGSCGADFESFGTYRVGGSLMKKNKKNYRRGNQNVRPPFQGKNRIAKQIRRERRDLGLPPLRPVVGDCFISPIRAAFKSSFSRGEKLRMGGRSFDYFIERKVSRFITYLRSMNVGSFISTKFLVDTLLWIDEDFDISRVPLKKSNNLVYHCIPHWKVGDCSLLDLFESGEISVVGMNVGELDLELSRMMASSSDRVKSMAVKDSVALRALEGAALEEFNFSKTFHDKKHEVLIPYKLEDCHQRALLGVFPELRLRFLNSALNPHALAAAVRLCYNHLFKFRFQNIGIIDIGGDVKFHVNHSFSPVHICNPILDAKDASRYTIRNIDWERTLTKNLTKVVGGKSNVTFCYTDAKECSHQAKVAIAVEVYDLSVEEIALIMALRDIDILHITLVCPGELLDEHANDIPVPDLRIMIRHSEDKKSLSYFMPEGTGYSHEKEKVTSFARKPVFLKGGFLFHCELLGTRLSVSEYRITRNKSYPSGSFKIPVSVPRATASLVAIRIPDWQKKGNFLKNQFSQEIMVDRVFFVRAIEYVMGITSVVSDKTFEYATTWLRNNSARIVISGKVIHQDVRIDTKLLEKVAAILLVIGARKKSTGTRYAKKLSVSTGTDLTASTLFKEKMYDLYGTVSDGFYYVAKHAFPFLGFVGDLDVNSLFRECDNCTNFDYNIVIPECGAPLTMGTEIECIDHHIDNSIFNAVENQIKEEVSRDKFIPSFKFRGSASRTKQEGGGLKGAGRDSSVLDFLTRWLKKTILKGVSLFFSFIDLLERVKDWVTERFSKAVILVKQVLVYFTPDGEWLDVVTLGLPEIIYQSLIFLWDFSRGKGVIRSLFSFICRLVSIFGIHAGYFKNVESSTAVFRNGALISSLVTLFERRLIGDCSTYLGGIMAALICTGLPRALIRFHIVQGLKAQNSAFGPYVLSNIDNLENVQIIVDSFYSVVDRIKDIFENFVYSLADIAVTRLSENNSLGRGIRKVAEMKNDFRDRMNKVRSWLGVSREEKTKLSFECLSSIPRQVDVCENDDDFYTVKEEESEAAVESSVEEFLFDVSPSGGVAGGGTRFTSVTKRLFLLVKRIIKSLKRGFISSLGAMIRLYKLVKFFGWRIVVDVITVLKLQTFFRRGLLFGIEDLDIIQNLGSRTVDYLDSCLPDGISFTLLYSILTSSDGDFLLKKYFVIHSCLKFLAQSTAISALCIKNFLWKVFLTSLPTNTVIVESDPSSHLRFLGMRARILHVDEIGRVSLPFGGFHVFDTRVFLRVIPMMKRNVIGGRLLSNNYYDIRGVMREVINAICGNVRSFSQLLGIRLDPLKKIFDFFRGLKEKSYNFFFSRYYSTNSSQEDRLTNIEIDFLSALDEDFLMLRLAADVRLVYLSSVESERLSQLSSLGGVPGNGGSSFISIFERVFDGSIFSNIFTTSVRVFKFFFYGTLITAFEAGVTSNFLSVGITILKSIIFGVGWLDVFTCGIYLREKFPWNFEEFKNLVLRRCYTNKACDVIGDGVKRGMISMDSNCHAILSRISESTRSLRKCVENFNKRRERGAGSNYLIEKWQEEILHTDSEDVNTTCTDISGECSSHSSDGSSDDTNDVDDSEIEPKGDFTVAEKEGEIGTSCLEAGSEVQHCLPAETRQCNIERSELKRKTKKKSKKKKNPEQSNNSSCPSRKGEEVDITIDGHPVRGGEKRFPNLTSKSRDGIQVLETLSEEDNTLEIYRPDINKLNFQLSTLEQIDVTQPSSAFQKHINDSLGSIIPPPQYGMMESKSRHVNEYIYNRVLDFCNVRRTVMQTWTTLKESGFKPALVVNVLDPHVALFDLKKGITLVKGKPSEDTDYGFCFDGYRIRPFLGKKEGMRVDEPYLILHEDLRVFYCELFLRRFKTPEFVNYDFSFVAGFQVVESPPGGGKTTELVATFVTLFSRGVETRVVTANRNSCLEIKKKVIALLIFKKICEDGPVLRMKLDDSIRTADSACMNVLSSIETKVLLIDEFFMLHSGQILFLISLFRSEYIVGYGDSNQIGYINRSDLQVAQYCNINEFLGEDCRSYRSKSYRCPVDVCKGLSKIYDREIEPVANPRVSTLEVVPIRSQDDLEFESDVKYITFTQGEKNELSKCLSKKGKVFDGVQTVHEVQGNTYQRVRLVRIKPQDDAVFSSQVHITVALSRHVENFRYYVINVKTNDLTCDRIKLSKELTNISNEIADHGPYIEAVNDVEYIETIDNRPIDGMGPPGSSTSSAFQDFLEEVIPGTTLVSLGDLSAELSTSEFKSVADGIKLKNNTQVGKKPIDKSSQRVRHRS